MRKNNWIVAAIAAVACGVLLWAWFALGFNHVDDPLDLVVAVVWWLAVAAVVGGIVWAEGKRREKMLPPMYFPPFTPMIHNRSRQPAPAGYANVFPPLSAPPPNLSRNARASRARALSEPG